MVCILSNYINGYEYNKFQSFGLENKGTNSQENYLYHYNFRNLLQKLYAVFDMENMPKSWDKRLLFNVVFLDGVGCAFDHPDYGLMFQPCTFRDVTVNYQPAKAVISNPYMKLSDYTYTIGEDCELIYFDLNYCSMIEMLDYFADLKTRLLAVIFNQSMNLNNPNIFACGSKRIADSLKKMYDDISQGKPSIFADKELFTVDGELNVQQFNKELSKNFILTDVYELVESVEQSFLETIGVPRMYFKKRERMTDDEVNKNDVNTSLLRDSWLDVLNECCERVNNMFGTEVRFKVSENIVNGGKSNVQSPADTNLL